MICNDFIIFGLIAGNESENNSNASDINASSGITSDNFSSDGVSSIETSPSTRQYTPVTQATIIKRKGLKPESTDIEVCFCKLLLFA